MECHYIYIITNITKTLLHVGITNDLQWHLQKHREGRAGELTAKYGVWHLLYFEIIADLDKAIARKEDICAWHRYKKVRLIDGVNPNWEFLAEDGEVSLLY